MRPNNESGPVRAEVGFDAGGTCFLVADAVDESAGEQLRAIAEACGFDPTGTLYPPSYRNNDRLVRDDAGFADELFERVRERLPATVRDGHGALWSLDGLNTRFRFCRYTDGQSFRIHRDGAYAEGDRRSFLTLQIYLDDGDRFRGGRTRFYSGRCGVMTGAVVAKARTAVVFDHDLWHDGEPVTDGWKHVVRTDVVYRRARTEADEAPGMSHEGYVFSVLGRSDGSIATGSRDRTIRIWRDGRCETVLKGHTASVIALLESGDAIVSASRDGSIRSWDVGAGESRVIGKHGGAALSLARTKQGWIASGGGDGLVKLTEPSGDAIAELAGHRGWVWSLAAIGDRIVSGSEDGTLRVWDPASRACVAVIDPGHGAVHALVALAGQRLAAGFADGTVASFRFASAGRDLRLESAVRAHAGEVYTLAALDDDRLASGGEDGVVRITSLDDGWTSTLAEPGCFIRALLVKNSCLLSAGYDGAIRSHALEEYPLTRSRRLAPGRCDARRSRSVVSRRA